VGNRMKKQTKRFVSIAAIALLLVSLGSIAAVWGQPTLETRANRIVEVAVEASERVGDLIILIDLNETVETMIDEAGYTEAYEKNITLYGEGVEKVEDANECLADFDYEGAIDNATEALSIFREVYRSINYILYNSDVKVGQFLDVEDLEAAIERSKERVNELKDLISVDSSIYEKLLDAESYLTQALEYLPDNIDEAKASLKDANILISEVCQYLKEIAQELNPQRIRDYCEGAYQYRERFRYRFEQAETEGFDVDGFLKGHGYQNEDEFMARFQEMIQNAEGAEDIEDVLYDLEEIGRLIRGMDQNLTQEMGRYRAQHGQTGSTGGFGQEATGSGYGQEGSGYGGSGGSGQMGFGGSQ